jgi:hypothetical protein
MAIVNFSNLDFDQIKQSIREYLRANSNFVDYDFEGSNLSTLIDVLSYNTYITSYNANMLSNEVFIDSATLRENVVSLARNIGYVPRSVTSSRASISFFVDITNLSISNLDPSNKPLTLSLQKGIVCTSQNFGSKSYTYTLIDNVTAPVVNNIALFDNIEIVEGTPITESFTVDYSIPNQKFILSNSNIDTSTLNVYVRNSQGSSVVRKFNLSQSLFEVKSNSRVFFIQEVEDQRYELIFGDDIFGKKLDNGNVVEVTYNISRGSETNGASSFSYAGRIFDNEGRLITSAISLITTTKSAYGGKSIESTEYVRKFAPRIYSAQNRAVTASDYESILPKIYPEIESISAFGGEELNPPKFGKVFISIKPINGPFLSNQVKDNIKNELRKYNVAGIVPEIVDLKYLYIEYDSTVYYNPNLVRSPSEVLSRVNNTIYTYSKSSELNAYGSRFKYSKFLKIIDDTSNSITSNITKIKIRRDLRAELNKFADYEICYGNEFHISSKQGFNVKSSGFSIAGVNGTVYLTDIPVTEETGKIIIFKLQDNSYTVVRKNAGIIDYKKGEIKLYPLNILSTLKLKGSDSIIEISAYPKSNDIIGLQDLYLQLDISNSNLSILEDTISSGNDISGTNYNVTSSYLNGSLIRK